MDYTTETRHLLLERRATDSSQVNSSGCQKQNLNVLDNGISSSWLFFQQLDAGV
jgi:hypothetical protein